MDRWKTVAIATIGAVILNVSAVAKTGGQSGSGARQGAGASQSSVPAAPSGLTVAASATQNPESTLGSETPAMTRPDPATKSKMMGADPMVSGSAMKPERIRATKEALKSKGHDPGPIDGIFGPQTEAALKSFQKAENLRESGRGDVPTLSKLGVR
jgi:peptidoglycan hydrolase-like protein with peptidoglycan-binding domain